MFYRVKQFFMAITAKLEQNELLLIHEYLSEKEKKIFFKLAKSEQKHSVLVAKDVLKYIKQHNLNYSIDENRMVKVALLHDIGKVKCRLNVVEKSVLVILNKISNGKIRNIQNKKIYLYYNHSMIGYEILKDFNYDDDFLLLIKNHHMKYENISKKNIELMILKKCDDNN